MPAIAILNQKGGAGKTTTAVNLAAALGEMGKPVVVVDLDQQANATFWLGADAGPQFAEALIEEQPLIGVMERTGNPGVAVVPSAGPHFAPAERHLQTDIGGRDALRRMLEKSDALQDAFVLFDCPPNTSILTINALVASRYLLIPVVAEYLPLHGIVQLQETFQKVRERANDRLEILGALACRVDRRAQQPGEIVALLRERFPGRVFQTEIGENRAISEASSIRQPITQFRSSSRGARDFRNLATEILELIDGKA